MRTVFDHIENVKGKPHHVRKRVVYGIATVGTAVVAIIWLGVSLSTNSFALKPSSFADSVEQAQGVVATAPTNPDNVAAAAAAVPAVSAASGPSRIEIVAATSTPVEPKSEPTTIPF